MPFKERYMNKNIREESKAKESLAEIFLGIESLSYGWDSSKD